MSWLFAGAKEESMNRRTCLCLGVLALLVAPLAGATVLLALEVEDLAILSPVVLVGEVNAVESGWNPQKTRIHTHVLITPIEVLKGPADLGTVKVKFLGGKAGDTMASLPGAPRFEVGEKVLLFLEPRRDQDGYLPVGFYQGKFKVFTDPVTKGEMLLRDGPDLGVKLLGGAADRPETVKTLDEVREVLRRMGGAK
jgi:hypothetical protein